MAMSVECREFEVYRTADSYVVAIGGGVSTAKILQMLRILYMGYVKYDEKIPQLITSGDGPTRFVRCHRENLKPEFFGKTTARDILEYERRLRDRVTYEVRLRWFLINSGGHMRGQGRIAVLPPEPLEIKGKPQTLLFFAGPDGPYIILVDIQLDEPWPAWDFLTAWGIDPVPYCP